MEAIVGEVRIQLVMGDITTAEVDAIVNAESHVLKMKDGVSKAILDRGGEKILTEALTHAPTSVGRVVQTTAGKLNAKYVFHAVTMDYDCTTDIIKIRECTHHSLMLATKNNSTSIAFPALGTGLGDFPPDLCAQTMLNTTRKYIQEFQNISLKEIKFYLYDQSTFEAFEEVFRQL